MTTVGVICEYNPFHRGHETQIRAIRARYGADTAVVCLMSGNYVQRGEPAVFPKELRTHAALLGGADLVVELPLTWALSSAEGFAAGGVEALTDLGCQVLSFGCEHADTAALLETARLLLQPELEERLRTHLASGCSYPTARALALADLGGTAATSPNDILAVEYCKAILRQNSPLEAMVVPRTGDYHALELDPEHPSATALRALLIAENPNQTGEETWLPGVPEALQTLYRTGEVHSMAAGERAVLARLRCLTDAEFEALPYGSEGLWSKLMKACRSCASVEEILTVTKSKRYARSRLQRMLLCAFLGLTAADLDRKPPYLRVLGFNDRGRTLLRDRQRVFPLINAGQRPQDAAYYALETRASDLYGLFSHGPVASAGAEAALRVRYLP